MVKKLKNGKATMDIPVEVFKSGPALFSLYELVVKIWKQRKMPKAWRHASLIGVPKKAPGELRPISLSSAGYKIYASILQQRVLHYVSKWISNTQCGFLPGRSTSDVLNCINRLIETSIVHKSPLHALMIDFAKAFDNVSRSAMHRILIDIGMDNRMVERIMDLLTHTTVSVKVGSKESKIIETLNGVRQGCPISPLLFIVVLNHFLVSVMSRFGGVLHFEFADDVTLVGTDSNVLDDAFQIIQDEGPAFGLFVAPAKTEKFSVEKGKFISAPIRLLGLHIGDYKVAIQKRIEKARTAFRSLYFRLWKTDVSVQTKLRVLNAVVIPTLLYGLETLPIDSERARPLDYFVYRCIRSILNIPYDQPGSYDNILMILTCEHRFPNFKWPSEILKERIERDFWHFLRHHPDVYRWNPEGFKRNTRSSLVTRQALVQRWGNFKYKEMKMMVDDMLSTYSGVVC